MLIDFRNVPCLSVFSSKRLSAVSGISRITARNSLPQVRSGVIRSDTPIPTRSVRVTGEVEELLARLY